MKIPFHPTDPMTSTAARSPEERRRAAEAALGGRPGDVDITYGKIGDRWGFVVSVAHPSNLDIEIKSELFKGKVIASYLTSLNAEQYLVNGDGARIPEDLGISRQMMRGRSITAP